ncbi:MAG TPA: YIP1 family protein [Gemmatimonadaceae bacterium]|nr:YIP1 family protein [Gemmatimonadaceae bacterium]
MSESAGGSATPGDAPQNEAPSADITASRWEDFIDIFYAPSAVFRRRATSGFLLPMTVVTVLTGALYIMNSGVWSQVMDAEMSRAMARQSQQISEEQMQGIRRFSETMAKVGAFVFVPVGIFLTGLMLWVCGKFVDARQTLRQATMVASFAFLPRVVEAVVVAVQGLLLDPGTFDGRWRVSLGVGRFFDPDATSPALLAFLGRIDVFTIWVTVLLAIGLAVTGNVSRGRAAIAAAIVWVLGSAPLLLQARG